MRKIILSTLLAAAMMVPANMFAQESNRDAEGKIVRGPYMTNGLFDNIFIGVGAGINGYFGETEKAYKPGAGAQLDIQVGKWITPDVGVAIGYSGLNASGRTTHVTPFTVGDPVDGYYKESMNFAYVYGNIMWNMSNSIWGYKSDRIYNCIPYLTFGYEHSFRGDVATYSRNFAEGAGILNTFRVHKMLNITADARAMIISGKFHTTAYPTCVPSLTVGLQVELGKNTIIFHRAPGVTASELAQIQSAAADAVAAQAAAEAQNAALREKNAQLEKDTAQAKADAEAAKLAAAEAAKAAAEINPYVVFFTYGYRTATENQLFHLDNYVKFMLDQDPERTFTVTGYCDRSGSSKYNMRLSKARAEYVKVYLMNKFNISADRIIVKYVGDTEAISETAEINRVVVVK